MPKEWRIIGRGFQGWHANGVSAEGHKISGSYGTLEGYASEAVNGALVYDAKHLEGTEGDSAFYSLVMRGPMVNPSLGDNQVGRFVGDGKPQTYKEGDYLGSLDFVGVGVYERLLRSIPGIKLGKVENGSVIWE